MFCRLEALVERGEAIETRGNQSVGSDWPGRVAWCC